MTQSIHPHHESQSEEPPTEPQVPSVEKTTDSVVVPPIESQVPSVEKTTDSVVVSPTGPQVPSDEKTTDSVVVSPTGPQVPSVEKTTDSVVVPSIEPDTVVVKDYVDPLVAEVLAKYNDAHVYIIYASQTGNAERFAKGLCKFLRRFKIMSHTAEAAEFKLDDLCQLKSVGNVVVVFILATYGNGEQPDNGVALGDWLASLPAVVDLNYSVFALGDRSYDNFCKFGRDVDTAMSKLGAKVVVRRYDGDSGVDLESTYMEWRQSLYDALVGQVRVKTVELSGPTFDFEMKYIPKTKENWYFTGEPYKVGSYSRQKKPYHAKNPFLAKVLVKREMYNGGNRSCLHMELDINNSSLRYQPGDHVGVYPANNPHMVNWFGQLLGVDLDELVDMVPNKECHWAKKPFPCPATLRTAFTYYLDITAPVGMDLLTELMRYTTSSDELNVLKSLTNPSNNSFYQQWIVDSRRGIVAVLEDFNSCRPPMQVLLESLPRLSCRYYSITSSPAMFGKSVHIAFVVIDWITSTNRKRQGVATSYLAAKKPGDEAQGQPGEEVPIFIRRAQNFHLPEKSATPVIMIGCGTGLAPFRGFIQHREKLKREDTNSKIGDMALFFGCRNRDVDYLFGEELQMYQDTGVLTHLYTAFSRDTPKKVYVTELIKRHGQIVWLYLERNAHIYVCGSAKILRDVQDSIYQVVQQNGNKQEEQVKAYINNLTKKGRYCVDVW